MITTIGGYDASTRTVPATFIHAGITHTRAVNACLDGDGGFDADATRERVDQVALGVERKITIGAITNPPPPPPIVDPATDPASAAAVSDDQ